MNSLWMIQLKMGWVLVWRHMVNLRGIIRKFIRFWWGQMIIMISLGVVKEGEKGGTCMRCMLRIWRRIRSLICCWRGLLSMCRGLRSWRPWLSLHLSSIYFLSSVSSCCREFTSKPRLKRNNLYKRKKKSNKQAWNNNSPISKSSRFWTTNTNSGKTSNTTVQKTGHNKTFSSNLDKSRILTKPSFWNNSTQQ